MLCCRENESVCNGWNAIKTTAEELPEACTSVPDTLWRGKSRTGEKERKTEKEAGKHASSE